MPTLVDNLRAAILDAVDTYLGAACTLEFQVGPSTEVATITLNNPVFNNASAGSMSIDTTGGLSDTSATGNASAIDQAVFKVSGTTAALTVSVGTGGGEINFSGSAVVGSGDTVTLTSFSLTCPAS